MPANSGQLVLLQDRSVVGGFHLSRAKTTGIIYSCMKKKDFKTNCKFCGLLMYILPQQLYYDMHTQYTSHSQHWENHRDTKCIPSNWRGVYYQIHPHHLAN